MKAYIDVLITSRYEDPQDFISAMKRFGDCTTGWGFLNEESEEYASLSGVPSCMLLKIGNKYGPAVAITVKKNDIFYIANIVPKKTGHIPMAEYNNIANQFFVDVKKYTTRYKLKLKIKKTNECIGLPEIIHGTKTRAFFEKYLKFFPTSHHPLDLERLDAFICAISRYSKGRIDLGLLKTWLITKKNGPKKMPHGVCYV